MMLRLTLAALALAAAPALAQDVDLTATGDAAEGEKAFRQCIACHVVQNDEGEMLAGRAGKTGPNLFKVAGRTAGTLEGFRYQPGIVAAGEKGLVWNEAAMIPYLQDPTKFLREFTGDQAVRSGMTYKVRKEEDAKNLYAYLVSLAGDHDDEDDDEGEEKKQ